MHRLGTDRAIDSIHARLDELQARRRVPRPTARAKDPALAELRAAMRQPASKVPIELIRPHDFSAAVLKISCAPRPVILKRRSRAWKPVREQANYMIAGRLGLEVVAPCIGLEASQALLGSVWARCIRMAQPVAPMTWGTAELVPAPPFPGLTRRQCCALWPAGTDRQSLPGLAGLEFADLVTAYLTLDHPPSFLELLGRISQPGLEQLIIYHALSLQSDGGAPNLMLQALPGGQFRLVSIDNTCSWGTARPGQLQLAVSDEDEVANVYWYPAALVLPGADKPVSAELRQLVCEQWTPDRLAAIIRECGGPVEAVEPAVARLVAIQRELSERATGSLRELAFAAVPDWARDWEATKERKSTAVLHQMLQWARDAAPSPEQVR